MFNEINQKISKKIANISPNIRKTIANTSWLMAGRIFRALVGFVVTALLARYLGVTQFGILNYAFALIAIFANIAQMGVCHFVLRDVVNEPAKRHEILGTAAFLEFISGITSFLSIIVVIFILRPDDPLARMMVIIMSSSLVFQGVVENIDTWFQSKLKSKYAILSEHIAFAAASIGKIVLIYLQAPLVAFALLILAENTLVLCNYIFVYQRQGEKIQNWRINWRRFANLAKVNFPLILSNSSVMMYLYADQIMLGQLADAHAVGIYAAAVKLSENWAFLVLSITRSVAPSIMEAKKVSQQQYYQTIQNLCNLLVAIFYGIAIVLTLFSTPIVLFVFGEKFAPAAFILSIHIWSSIWMFFNNVKQVWVAAEEMTVFAMAASFSGAFMNIGLNFWLIPIYQELGAAIATVISYLFAEYLVCWIYPPARKYAWVMTKALALNILTQKKSSVS